jgi:hypothetical protein
LVVALNFGAERLFSSVPEFSNRPRSTTGNAGCMIMISRLVAVETYSLEGDGI